MADKYLSAYYNGNNGNKIYLELHVYTVATSIANNTTTERADLYAVVNDASYQWWNSYGSEAHINVNANTTTRTVNFDYRSTGVKGLISTWDTVVKHDNNGNASIPISAHHYSGLGLGNASVSGTYICDNIPRYATSNQSFNNKTETTITMNWSSDNIIDYIWYSTNNGLTWAGVDVTDGTSGTYTISGLSANTTYNIKTRVRRKDSQLTTDSGSLAVKTYSYPTQTIASKTETSITVNWYADSMVDAVHYSLDNGANWSNYIASNSTNGSYTISGLSANGTYNVKTRVKRKDTQTYSDTNVSTVTTYNYPYCTEAPDFTIGNALTIKFYNPLNRTIKIQMWSHVSRNFVSDLITINGTSYTGFNNVTNRLYESIPNSTQSKYNIDVYYENNKAIKEGGNYSINVNANIPTISNGGWGYYDSNQLSRNLTGNNKMLVNNLSNVFVSVSGDAISIKNSATLSSIKATIGDKSVSLNYNRTTNEYTGTIYSINSSAIFVVIVDSRGIQNTYSIDVNNIGLWKNFSKPIFNQVDTSRENGIGTTGLLNLKVNFWNANFGAIANEITKFSYRYKKTTDTSYSSFIDITDRMDLNSNGYYINASDAFLPTTDKGTIATVFEVGYEYNLQFACVDKSKIVVYSDVITLNSGIPCTAKQKNSDGTYSIGINCLPDENFALSINGGLKVDGEFINADEVKNQIIQLSFNNNYVYSEDLSYICIKIGKIVMLNIHTIAFKQLIPNFESIIYGLPKPKSDIIMHLQGGQAASGKSVRVRIDFNGNILTHYSNDNLYGDSQNIQYTGTAIYETNE